MKPRSSRAAVLCLLGGLAAQDKAAPSAQAECSALVAEVKASEKEYRVAAQAVQATEDYQAAAKARDSQKMRALMAELTQVDYDGFTKRFEAAADKYAGTDDAIPFLVWIAHNARSKEAGRTAVETLVDRHADDPKMLEFAENARLAVRHYDSPDATAEVLERLAENSKQALVRAWAMYWHASLLQRGRSVAESAKEKAADLLQQARKLAEGTDLADMIDAPAFEAERLQIGMEAPDIVAADLDGVPFKLSDYRGKVVVLDFWGDW
ncbi:MAG: hypothetical protein R3F56_01715 [Planctomycetota bacterium]